MNYIITIGRQLGSGGKQLGDALSKQLQIPCYDKELIRIASYESGLGKEFFENADEKNRYGFFGHLFGLRSYFVNNHTDTYLSNETLFQIQSDVIRKLAGEGSCIFIGRCADYILRTHDRCLKIFISAALHDRIERVAKDRRISQRDAQLLIEQADRKRAAYYNYYTNKTWGQATSYDLCLNSSVFTMDAIVRIVEEQARELRVKS